MNIKIRPEQATDIDAITQLTQVAFQHQEYSSHTEHVIINALRQCHQLTISLVVVDNDRLIGHVAISPVTISFGVSKWYGLGPISVSPERQRTGVGIMLMKESLAELQRLGGLGCVVLGDPAYYGRFGFKAYPELVLPGVPNHYFQARSFGTTVPQGEVCYQDAFNATDPPLWNDHIQADTRTAIATKKYRILDCAY